MTDREKAYHISGQATGVIAALYGVLRDISAIGVTVDDEKNGKLGDVVGDTFDALAELPELVKDEEDSEEPRILTLEEVLKSGNKLMWLEFKSANTPEHYELYPTSPYDDNRPDTNAVSFQSGHVQTKGLYGRQWRCWTEKPSVADAMDWD